MVNQYKKDKLDDLLRKGYITQKEYDVLLKELENPPKTGGSIVISVILTIFSIISVLYGTCLVNMFVIESTRSEKLIVPLSILWILSPIFLFIWRAHKTKNSTTKKGIKRALTIIGIIVLLILVISMR